MSNELTPNASTLLRSPQASLRPGRCAGDALRLRPGEGRHRNPGGRLDDLLSTIDPHLEVANVNTGEHMATDFVERGSYDDRALNGLDWFFRDWRNDQGTVMDRRIYWALAAVAAYARRQGASGRIMLVAGFRSPESTNLLRASGGGASSNSFHMRGRAADIQVEGMPTEEVAGYAQWLQLGGVGYDPDEGFTHIDTGPVRLWQA